MSKCATINYVNNITGQDLGGGNDNNKLINKITLITNYNIDEDLVQDITNTKIVTEDKVVKKETLPLIFELYDYDITSYTNMPLNGIFCSTKPFKIEIEGIFNNISSTTNQTCMFIIVDDAYSKINLGCLKANMGPATSADCDLYAYYTTYDGLGSICFGHSTEGQVVQMVIDYDGDLSATTLNSYFSSNLPISCSTETNTTSRKSYTATKIYFGKDPRWGNSVLGNHIDKLKIYCEQ